MNQLLPDVFLRPFRGSREIANFGLDASLCIGAVQQNLSEDSQSARTISDDRKDDSEWQEVRTV